LKQPQRGDYVLTTWISLAEALLAAVGTPVKRNPNDYAECPQIA